MNTITIQPIRKELLVEASQETTFKVFTEKMDLWWPRTHHVGACPMTETVLEPGANGRWYTKHEDGTEVNIGYILKWDPYAGLILAWQINGDFKCDPSLISEVELQFISDGPDRTTVKFEHRDLELLGGGKKLVEDMDGGWQMILELFKNIAEK